MSTISNYGNIAGSTNNYNNTSVDNQKKKANETENTGKTSNFSKTDKNGKITGKTIGQPKLSEKAAKYYEQLKKKYSNMDFILVSEDKKEQAKAQASSYANASKMVVLIDEDKVERMAEDENYRKQYEAIIANAASGISRLKSSLESSGANVKGFGMQVNDGGTATYFAVLEESSAAQRERIEKKAAEKKAEKKAAEKKAEKKHQKEKLEEARSEKTEKTDVSDKTDTDSGTVTITASSVEELLQKIQDYMQLAKSDTVLTEAEKKVGQNIDFCG